MEFAIEIIETWGVFSNVFFLGSFDCWTMVLKRGRAVEERDGCEMGVEVPATAILAGGPRLGADRRIIVTLEA